MHFTKKKNVRAKEGGDFVSKKVRKVDQDDAKPCLVTSKKKKKKIAFILDINASL